MPSNGIKDGTLAVLIKLAERPEGVSAGEAARAVGKHSDACSQVMYLATKRGRLHKAGPHMKSRWFVHPAHAQAYERKMATVQAGVAVRLNGARGAPTAASRKAHAATLGEHNRQRMRMEEGEPIITSATKVTIAPPPRSRYQVDEAPRVVSSEECRPWAREASR